MNALEFILDGLEAELALERELGVRSVEFDRSLLNAVPCAPRAPSAPPRTAETLPRPAEKKTLPAKPTEPKGRYEIVFLHDRPLSPEGAEMVQKIVTGLGTTAESSPVIVDLPIPPGRVYVILGARALRKFFPGQLSEPGRWLTRQDGTMALVTYSPEYFLRFKVVTSAVQQMKRTMWTSLKDVRRHMV